MTVKSNVYMPAQSLSWRPMHVAAHELVHLICSTDSIPAPGGELEEAVCDLIAFSALINAAYSADYRPSHDIYGSWLPKDEYWIHNAIENALKHVTDRSHLWGRVIDFVQQLADAPAGPGLKATRARRWVLVNKVVDAANELSAEPRKLASWITERLAS